MAEHNELGFWGEKEAAKYLRKHGYVIKEIDWRLGHRDLDIIAITEDGEWLVFVEVKTLTGDELIDPTHQVTKKKMQNLAFSANAYIKSLPYDDFKMRFDIVSIVGTEGDVKRIEHIEDAFNPLMV